MASARCLGAYALSVTITQPSTVQPAGASALAAAPVTTTAGAPCQLRPDRLSSLLAPLRSRLPQSPPLFSAFVSASTTTAVQPAGASALAAVYQATPRLVNATTGKHSPFAIRARAANEKHSPFAIRARAANEKYSPFAIRARAANENRKVQSIRHPARAANENRTPTTTKGDRHADLMHAD